MSKLMIETVQDSLNSFSGGVKLTLLQVLAHACVRERLKVKAIAPERHKSETSTSPNEINHFLIVDSCFLCGIEDFGNLH